MRCLLLIAVVGWMAGAGCAAKSGDPGMSPAAAAAMPANRDAAGLIVTPQPILTGRVVSFNLSARFVVLNFPVGHLPVLEQRMDLFRQGIKVGEVKITGPQRDDHIVADVTAGEAQPGDEVRAR